MNNFLDIEGTEICQGDEILFTMITHGSSSSDMGRGIVERFTPNFMMIKVIKGYAYENKARISMKGCSSRVLVMKGEFKKYRKTELERHDE